MNINILPPPDSSCVESKIINPGSPYTVAVRTLGTAGKVFEAEIKSILRQTVLPYEILAYIPYGYDLPEDFEGMSAIKWIRCGKGMITQRSQDMSHIKTKYILFLDDDVELQPISAEMLISEIEENDGDCIAANVFRNCDMNLKQIISCFKYLTFPHFSKKYSVIIRGSAHYSYALKPANVMLSQSAAGPCSMIKSEVFNKLEFEQERWLEDFGYPLGEDLLMFNKIYQSGGRLLISNDCGAVHLDAKTGHQKNVKEINFKQNIIWYCLWHRTQYMTAGSLPARLQKTASYYASWLWLAAIDVVSCLKSRSLWRLKNRLKSLPAAKKYIKGERYSGIRPYIIQNLR